MLRETSEDQLLDISITIAPTLMSADRSARLHRYNHSPLIMLHFDLNHLPLSFASIFATSTSSRCCISTDHALPQNSIITGYIRTILCLGITGSPYLKE